ncbi:MAG: peptidylprolyl isomerase [Candidatus Omnitrophota bacterium]
MNKKKIWGVAACIIFTAFIVSGCDKVSGLFGGKQVVENDSSEYPVTEGKVIVRIGGDMVITMEELDRYIQSYNQQIDDYKERYPNEDIGIEKAETVDKKIELLKNNLIRQKLLYREALDRGLNKKEDIGAALEEFKISLLVAGLIKDETDKIKVTSEDIEGYYNRNKEMLREPEERKVREIMTRSKPQAKNALIEILQGADFSEVARKYSSARSASKGGDLGFIKPGTKFTQFDIAVYSLDVGGVSSVIKNPKANEFYVIKVEAKRGGKEKPLSEVWDTIKAALEQKRQKKAIDDLVGRLWRQTKVDILESEIH